MTEQRKFYRTVIQVEILSESPYSPQSLSEVDHDITDGDCSGSWDVVEVYELDGKAAATALSKQGSDPSFFNLDQDGQELTPDWDSNTDEAATYTIGESVVFNSTDSEYHKRSGETVTIIKPLDESKYDKHEVGPMYVIKFSDGTEAEAFEDELSDQTEATQ